MGPWHVRAIEAYSDSSNLVVRSTKLYDLRKDNAGVLDNLCRWWYGKAIRETKVLPEACI